MGMRTAVYPGSFDPVTNGHFDIIERAASMFDQLVTSVVVNPSKHCRFDVEERVQMLREVTAHLGNVRVDSFRGLTVDYLPNREVRRRRAGIAYGQRLPDRAADGTNELPSGWRRHRISHHEPAVWLLLEPGP